MNTGNPFVRLMAIQDEVERLKEAIADFIRSLPDNPQINRIGGRCFTVSSKDLGDNWTPFYHDFKSQAEFMIKHINSCEYGSVIPFIRGIIDKGSFYTKSMNYRFHPAFREHLKTLLLTYGGK